MCQLLMLFSLLTLFPVPNISDTDIDTFFRYHIFPIPIPVLFTGTNFFRYRNFFPGPNFSDTDTKTFSGTNFFRYRYRYHQKNEKIPVPGIPGTGTSHSDYQVQTELKPALGNSPKYFWLRYPTIFREGDLLQNAQDIFDSDIQESLSLVKCSKYFWFRYPKISMAGWPL